MNYQPDFYLLITSAITIAFFHTVLGPDHYLPFIVMAKSGKWSKNKTFWVTLLSGIGHIGSSIVLGIIGIIFGVALNKLLAIESFRGNVAAWLLIAFGFAYTIWALRRLKKKKPHIHLHYHPDGHVHTHTHTHLHEHSHIHEHSEKPNMTPWILFTVFVFGPCEPLIPLLMYPAAKNNFFQLAIVTLVFGLITIGTMLSVVFLSFYGLNRFPLKKVEKYSHVLAGATIFISGLVIVFLGL